MRRRAGATGGAPSGTVRPGGRGVGERRARRRGDRGDRGAVLVEAAFVFPLLLLLTFGIIEFGLIFKDVLTIANMTRAGARTGAAAGNDQKADYEILMAVRSSASALGGTLNGVIIYKASATNGALPASCSLASGSQPGLCNVYTGAEVEGLMSTWSAQLAAYPNSFGCTGGWDNAWCPTSRIVSQSVGPDYLGVYVSTLHQSVTRLFGSLTLTDQSVMRLEPQTI